MGARATPDARGAGNRLAGVDRIAVVRANALGDLLFALPALEALRAAYPRADVTLFGTAVHQALLDGRPGPVDRVVVVPPGAGLPEVRGAPASPGEVEAFFAVQREQAFDLVVQLHGGGANSNPFARRLAGRVTVGLRARGAPPLDRWVPYRPWQPEMARHLEVVGLVGATPTSLEPHLSVTERDLAEAAAVLASAGADAAAPFVVLHPGATDARRRWPVDRFAAVGDALADRDLTVVTSGDAGEAALTRRLVEAMGANAVDVAGRLTMPALTGLLSRAALVVANDTGPLHLATAVGTATVGVYWCGNLVNFATPTRRRHRPVVSWELRCPTCGEPNLTTSCRHEAGYVRGVTVHDVLDEALDLLS